jgi:hypothetical protein
LVKRSSDNFITGYQLRFAADRVWAQRQLHLRVSSRDWKPANDDLIHIAMFAVAKRRLGPHCKLGESLVTVGNELVAHQLSALGFRQTVEHTENQAPDHDRRDLHDGSGELKLFHVGEDFVFAAILAEFLPCIDQLDSGKILAPFVIEGAVLSPAVSHPEATAVKENSVTQHISSARKKEGNHNHDRTGAGLSGESAALRGWNHCESTQTGQGVPVVGKHPVVENCRISTT